MRGFAQDRAFYRRVRVDGTDDEEALRRLSVLEGIEEMRERFPALGARMRKCWLCGARKAAVASLPAPWPASRALLPWRHHAADASA